MVRDRFPFDGYITQGGREKYRDIAATVRRHVARGGRVLDFGCGPCDVSGMLAALGFECHAYDDLQDDWHRKDGAREKIIEFCRDSGVDFTLSRGGPLPYERSSFEMVMMHGVIEHLHDSPREILNALVELLKVGGYLFITVPNAVNMRKRVSVLLGRTNHPCFDVYYWYPGPWRGHVREYTRGDLAKLAGNLGLEVVEMRGCHHMLEKLPAVVRPVYRWLAHPFDGWKDTLLLVARKGVGWTPRRRRHAESTQAAV